MKFINISSGSNEKKMQYIDLRGENKFQNIPAWAHLKLNSKRINFIIHDRKNKTIFEPPKSINFPIDEKTKTVKSAITLIHRFPFEVGRLHRRSPHRWLTIPFSIVPLCVVSPPIVSSLRLLVRHVVFYALLVPFLLALRKYLATATRELKTNVQQTNEKECVFMTHIPCGHRYQWKWEREKRKKKKQKN